MGIRIPIAYFLWLSGDVPRLTPYSNYILQLVGFARWCANVSHLYSKNNQITSKLLTQGCRYHNLGSSVGHTRHFCPIFVHYRLKNMFQKELLTQSSMVI